MKMNFREKSENVMFLHSLRLSFMPKIRKIYRAVFRENIYRETDRERERERERERDRQRNLSRGFPGKLSERDRETERDGPEYKGPPDAIAKPSDQKDVKMTSFGQFQQI